MGSNTKAFTPVTASAPCKYVVPPATVPVDGAGSLTFSNNQLIGFIVVVPLFITLAVGISFAWFPLIFVLTALPSFGAYNILFANVAVPIRQQKGLPGKPRDHYLKIKDQALAAKFPSKIPMETFFEAYFDQKIDLPEGQDMMYTLEHRYEWASFVFTLGNLKFFLTQWIPETIWHSKKQDEDQVREHYDRGDDFYNWFLGPRMIYTSGIISDLKTPETLEQLQDNKLNLVCDKINLKKGDKMLDIGCGWGTLSVHAAKRGANVTGVTLGRNQTAWGMGKAKEAGVADNVRILCMDYRDIPKEKYDKITCLEMAEHVGVRKFQEFLIQVREMLTDDGIFYLQIAGLRRAWQYEDLIWGLFMAKYVFPGADASAPLNWVLEQAERAGYEVAHCDTIGVHYSATIYRWYLNWMQNKEKVISTYGTRWFRVWEIFLAWSSIVARQGSATCYQIVLHKNLNAFDRNQFIGGRTKAASYN
ncbi:S-adenosyl-L-methionine-dependent methyltransferase, partial [Chytriomyces cf. hyalinus JEL632]